MIFGKKKNVVIEPPIDLNAVGGTGPVNKQREIASRQSEAIETTEQEAAEVQRTVDGRQADLAGRERELADELQKLKASRQSLAAEVEPATLSKYERMLKSKGSNVVVGIHRGVCGGCHMQLSRQTVVHCQAAQEMVFCTNCGRMLYYTRDMDVALAE